MKQKVARDKNGAILYVGDVVSTGSRRKTFHTIVAIHPEGKEPTVDTKAFKVGDGVGMKENEY